MSMRPFSATPRVGNSSTKSKSRLPSASFTLTGSLHVLPPSVERLKRILGSCTQVFPRHVDRSRLQVHARRRRAQPVRRRLGGGTVGGPRLLVDGFDGEGLAPVAGHGEEQVGGRCLPGLEAT